ncbi:MAG: hypothetical protein U9N73_02075, partial [Candidatus Auribacterota bacterium]|nr:hypothetical protein [Candidatus Auribacterota bacterium]
MKRIHNTSRWLIGIIGVFLFALPGLCDEVLAPAAVPTAASHSSSGFEEGIVTSPSDDSIPEVKDASPVESRLEPALSGPAPTPFPVWMLPYSAWSLLYPSPTPSGYRTPTPTPTVTPDASSAWIPPDDLSAARRSRSGRKLLGKSILGRNTDKQEITVTYPNRTTVRYNDYEETEYDPDHDTLGYSLLMEAYRSVYWDLFGISLTTPTPAPTAPPAGTPTPEDYKTPVPTATPTPTITPTPSTIPTPVQCNNPLKVADINNMVLNQTRAYKGLGWAWSITKSTDPGDDYYGYVGDNNNSFNKGSAVAAQEAVALLIKYNQQTDVDIIGGDSVTITYDGDQSINVYPPDLSGEVNVYYYIGEDGSTYNDPWLCQTAQAAYCNDPLEISDLEGMWIAHTRSSVVKGWTWRIAPAAFTSSTKYGSINDYYTTYYPGQSYPLQPVALNIFRRFDPGEDVDIHDGDWVTLNYDGGQVINVYPPALSGDIDTYYYVGDDGSTYSDRRLCELAKAVPTPAPLKIKTVNDLIINTPRATGPHGWGYAITTAWEPGTDVVGWTYDSENNWNGSGSFSPATEVALWIAFSNESVDIHDGDYLELDYEGESVSEILYIYPPPLNGDVDVYYYLGSDGATYNDRALTDLARAVPTPTAKTASRGAGMPVPTVPILQVSTPAPIIPSSPAPSPSPEPYFGPATFDLVGTLSAGSPIWSVWADDRYLYGGAGDGRVHIWERSATGFYFLETVGGYSDGNIYGVQSFRDNSRRQIYGASEDGSVYVWSYDIRSGGFSLLSILDQARGFMYSVAGDGEMICGASNDGGIYIWDGADFSLQTVLGFGLDPILSVSLDDEYIYTSSANSDLYLWNRDTFSLSAAFSRGTDIMWSTAVDSSYCYGGSSDPSVSIWSKGSFLLQTVLPEASGAIGSLSSDDREYLYGAGPEGIVYVWSNEDFSLQTILAMGDLTMNGVFADRYRPGDAVSHYIYGASADGNIYVWQGERTPTPTPTPTVPPSPTPLSTRTPAGYITPTPRPSSSPTPEDYQTPTPPPTALPTATSEGFITPSPSPSPTFGFTLPVNPSPSPTPGDLTLLAVLSRGEGWMFSVYADDKYIYGANEDKYIYIWDRSTYKEVKALTVPGCHEMLSVYADGKYIYGSNDDSRVYVWNKNNFDLLHVLGDGQYYAESVFADSDYLYASNYDQSLYIWNRGAFNLQSKLVGPGGWLNSVYADSGRIYAGSGGADYNVYLWDRATFDLKETLRGPIDDLNAVFADGKYIYGASADSSIYLWDYTAFYLKKILSEALDQMTSVISGEKYIYGASLDHGIYIWDKADFELYGVLDEIKQPMQWVYLDGNQIFAASRDGNIYVWQAPGDVKESGSIDSDNGIEYPPIPSFSDSSGSVVVKEFPSVAGAGDYYGGITFRDGYLYENISKTNILYKRDPADGTILGRIEGLASAKDMGLAWDPDHTCWYIADPWINGCSRVPAAGGPYTFSWDAIRNVAGLYYDQINHQLLASSNVKTYINIWEFDSSGPRQVDTIPVGEPQNGVVRVGDKLWAALSKENPPAPVYELNLDGSKTGRSFELPENREAWDMAWDGEYIWVRSDYRDGEVKIYQIDI